MSRPVPPTPGSLPTRVVEVPVAEIPQLPGGPDGPPVPTGVEGPNKAKQRVDFREDDFERLLAQHGKYCIWRKALLCPCHGEATGRSNINCAICDGSGYHYVDPIGIQAHMAQFESSTKIYEKFGMWMEGKCSITVLPYHRLGFRDSLEMRDSVMTFSEILTKGNRKGIRSVLPTGKDSARYRIVDMTRMLTINGTSTSASPVYLECETDYRIDDNGWIEWTTAGNARVSDGATLSVRYDFHPVWIINSFMHATRDDTSGRKSPPGVDRIVSLPLQAAGFLDFILDSNLPAETVAPVTGGL